MKYQAEKIPLIVLAGKDYGMGSSRDWAAKGVYLLGVKAVIAESFERIHRSNLVGMGVLPLVYNSGQTRASLGLTGEETFEILVDDNLQPKQDVTVKAGGKTFVCDVPDRYAGGGGVLPQRRDFADGFAEDAGGGVGPANRGSRRFGDDLHGRFFRDPGLIFRHASPQRLHDFALIRVDHLAQHFHHPLHLLGRGARQLPDANFRVARGPRPFVGAREFLVQLFARANAGEFDGDVLTGFEAGPADHFFGEREDFDRLAHVEDKDFPAAADGAGLHDKLARLGNRHEIAFHIGMGDGNRPAGFDLLAEDGDYAAAAASTLPKRTATKRVRQSSALSD
jgi:hypothetical protein